MSRAYDHPAVVAARTERARVLNGNPTWRDAYDATVAAIQAHPAWPRMVAAAGSGEAGWQHAQRRLTRIAGAVAVDLALNQAVYVGLIAGVATLAARDRRITPH